MTEVVIAVGIFSIVAVSMAGVLAGGLKGVLLGKQRAIATADANQLLETARSLAYADVGLASDDTTLDSDTAITTVSATNRSYGGEPIVFAASTVNHPFKPHVQTVTRSPSTLTRNIYVTGVDTTSDGVPDVRRITVRVSWARAAVGGVANSVTASTLVAPNSPGTPGNPPLGQATPCPGCPTPTPPPFPPIRGAAFARASDALLEADVGSASALDGSSGRTPMVLRLLGLNGSGSNELNAWSRVGCSQQTERLEAVIAGATVSTAGQKAENTADSVSNTGPYTQTRSQTDPVAGVVPAGFTVVPSTMVGGVTCTSSGVTSPPTLPSETGSGSFSALTTTVDTSAGPLTAPIGPLSLLEAVGVAAAQSVAQNVPADKQMDATSSHGLSEMKIMRQTGLAPGVLDLGAPDGLVAVGAYQATATTSASGTTGSHNVSVDPTKPLTIKIWDNGSATNLTDGTGGPVVCDQRSGNYCVITPSPTTQQTIREDQDYCLGLVPLVCLVTVHVDITVTINPAKGETLLQPDQISRVYRMDYAPVSAVVRLWAANVGVSSHALDVRTTTDVGRITACSKYGLLGLC